MQNVLKLNFAATALAVAWGYDISAIAEQPLKYPARPVRIIIPLGPGNSVEIDHDDAAESSKEYCV